MHAENLIINHGCDRQAIETVREGLPQFYVVPPLALIFSNGFFFQNDFKKIYIRHKIRRSD